MSATYEVHYFPARGRAEPVRLALAAGGATFTNVTPEWPASKPNYTYGQLPVLVETKDGKVTHISQSMAQLRHVGRVFGLYGKDENEQTEVDVALEGLADVMNAFVNAFYYSTPETKEDQMKKYNEETLPKYVCCFSRLTSEMTTY